MNRFMSTQEELFINKRNDLILQREEVKRIINVLNETIICNPDLLFGRMSISDTTPAKIVTKLHDYTRQKNKLDTSIKVMEKCIKRIREPSLEQLMDKKLKLN